MIRHHESGARHKNAVENYLRNVTEKRVTAEEQKLELQNQLEMIERAAAEAMHRKSHTTDLSALASQLQDQSGSIGVALPPTEQTMVKSVAVSQSMNFESTALEDQQYLQNLIAQVEDEDIDPAEYAKRQYEKLKQQMLEKQRSQETQKAQQAQQLQAQWAAYYQQMHAYQQQMMAISAASDPSLINSAPTDLTIPSAQTPTVRGAVPADAASSLSVQEPASSTTHTKPPPGLKPKSKAPPPGIKKTIDVESASQLSTESAPDQPDDKSKPIDWADVIANRPKVESAFMQKPDDDLSDGMGEWEDVAPDQGVWAAAEKKAAATAKITQPKPSQSRQFDSSSRLIKSNSASASSSIDDDGSDSEAGEQDRLAEMRRKRAFSSTTSTSSFQQESAASARLSDDITEEYGRSSIILRQKTRQKLEALDFQRAELRSSSITEKDLEFKAKRPRIEQNRRKALSFEEEEDD